MKYVKRFRVAPGSTVKLDDIDPGFKGDHGDRNDAERELRRDQDKLRALQELFYADGRASLLICLQGMDTGGKDGTINHILGAMNPQGCQVTGFKQPSPEELAHDFLWRVHKAVPPLGVIGIFNRSQYEDVLVVRVHELVEKSVWSERFEQINDFERMLCRNNVHILKFYLNISRSEQKKRLTSRLQKPSKNWKFARADLKERAYWRDYTKAYEDVLSRCSTPWSPWFVIPANHKWFRNLAVSQIVMETLEDLHMKFPKPDFDPSAIRIE